VIPIWATVDPRVLVVFVNATRGDYQRKRQRMPSEVEEAVAEIEVVLSRYNLLGVLSVKDAARLLGMTEQGVTAMCRRGDLDAQKIKGKWWVTLPDALHVEPSNVPNPYAHPNVG
jgi:hypothetical protein